jgi:hypothetical protein
MQRTLGWALFQEVGSKRVPYPACRLAKVEQGIHGNAFTSKQRAVQGAVLTASSFLAKM